MLNLFLKVMIKKCVAILRSLGGRKKKILILPLLLYLLILVTTCWWLVEMVTKALLPPPPPDQNLEHFRRNRSLAHYMDHISVLIEPSSVPCSDLDEVPLLILVTSAPSRFHHRQAVRNTWGSYQPTYFILGQDAHDSEGMLGDNYMEAKEHRDMVVYDFLDHYQNLTLKTALMIQWTIDRCPQAKFLLKTDDDVLVNPWAMEQVLKENREAQLLGYKLTAYLHRDEYAKWYIPRWIYPEDVVPDYLSGSGYLIAAGAGLDHKKCEPFISEYTDCTNENMCSGCTQCTCSAEGLWECKRVRVCEGEEQEKDGVLNDEMLQYAMETMQQGLTKKKKITKPRPHDLVPRPGQKLTKPRKKPLLGYIIATSSKH